MRVYLSTFIFLWGVTTVVAQTFPDAYRTKKVAVQDSIRLDSVNINPNYFKLTTTQNQVIDTSNYDVNYQTATLYLKKEALNDSDSLHVEYLKYPSFLTQVYAEYDSNIIVKDKSVTDRLYSLQEATRQNTFTPFEGLNTSGSISRGITIGNNQNAVVNSALDLQITGKISDKVSIRASIQDANIPIQEAGYSQGLEEFDEIFIELYSDNWNIRSGDIDLINE